MSRNTTYLSFLLLSFLSILNFSCKKESSTPSDAEPTSDFTFTPSSGYATCMVSFTSYSKNAIDYTWDFGDGSISIAQNPTHTYVNPGTYTITLKVKNGNKQSQKSQTIIIKRPYTKATLTKVVVEKMPFLDANGSGWDPLDGPDLFIQLLGPNPDNFVLEESGQIQNLTTSKLPVSWNLTTPFTFTNFSEFYFIQLMDYDSFDPNDVIDYVSFRLDSYISGSNAYPSVITRSQNNSTVSLYFNWAY